MSIQNPEGKREHPRTYGPTRTDQAAGPATGIGAMIAKYTKLGENFPAAERVLQYGDCSEIPTMHEMLNRVADANTAFMELPAAVRHKCGHSSGNFEAMLRHPDNKKFCEEHGLFNPKETVDNGENNVNTPAGEKTNGDKRKETDDNKTKGSETDHGNDR